MRRLNYFFEIFYTLFFLRTKTLILVKNLRISQEQSQACCSAEHNKLSRLAISKRMPEHQNSLAVILYIVLHVD